MVTILERISYFLFQEIIIKVNYYLPLLTKFLFSPYQSLPFSLSFCETSHLKPAQNKKKFLFPFPFSNSSNIFKIFPFQSPLHSARPKSSPISSPKNFHSPRDSPLPAPFRPPLKGPDTLTPGRKRVNRFLEAGQGGRKRLEAGTPLPLSSTSTLSPFLLLSLSLFFSLSISNHVEHLMEDDAKSPQRPTSATSLRPSMGCNCSFRECNFRGYD